MDRDLFPIHFPYFLLSKKKYIQTYFHPLVYSTITQKTKLQDKNMSTNRIGAATIIITTTTTITLWK